MRLLLLPRGYQQVNRCIEHSRSESSDDKDSISEHLHRPHSLVISHSSLDSNTQPQPRVQIEKFKEGEIVSSKEHNALVSTDDDHKSSNERKITTVKSWLDLTEANNEEQMMLPSKSSSRSKKRAFEIKMSQRRERAYKLDPLDGPSFRSEVISSSHMPPRASTSQLPLSSSSYRWDKLDTFMKTHQEKLLQLSNKPIRKTAPLVDTTPIAHVLITS